MVVALATVSVSCGAPAARDVTVITQSFRYEPSSLEWRVGQPVKLHLRNPDAVEHDFVIDGLKYSMAAGAAAHEAHSSSGAAAAAPTPHPDSLHVHVPAFAGTIVTFTPLSKGSYTIYCTIPGHKESGMTAPLVVT
jgi:uncharacterized cupredoxin-like copper-binding protein